MLTVEEPKVQDKENKNVENKDLENKDVKVEGESSETKDNEETKNEVKNNNETKKEKVGDFEIPPPPEFSVPLFTKYIHGHQRSVSVSSELSNDSYLYEENGTFSTFLYRIFW